MPTPFDSADPPLLEEIISQAEKRLQAQLELGKAADQRAMTFAGMLLAGVAILTGLTFGEEALTAQQPAFVLLTVGLIVSAGLALWSARPVDWDIPGNVPESYLEDIQAKLDFQGTRSETAFHLQDMISKNHDKLRCNGNWMTASMTIALVSIAAGIIAAIVAK